MSKLISMTAEEQWAIPLSRVSGITKDGQHVWWNVRQPDAVKFASNMCFNGVHLNYLQVTQQDGKVTFRWAHEIGAIID